MNYTDLNTIFTWFEEGDFPTAPQFQATFSSFYHKSENIPMAKVEGLDDVFGKYVLNGAFGSHLKDEKAHAKHLVKLDASNITEDYRTALRDALGVGDLPANIATTDYVDENAKNVGNAPIVSDVNGSFTQGSNWSHDTAGFSYYLKGLTDKSNDSTFNKMRVQDTNGQEAVSNGKEILKAMPSNLTEAEKTAWKTEMNGGWTTNTMSVALITPPIVDVSDKDYWLTLKGGNLTLNPANFSIQLIDSADVVIATIPNSQVQLYDNGIDLTFYFNFSGVPVGKYRVRLNNGVATYTTGSSTVINVVRSISSFNTSTINWDVKTHNDVVSSLNTANGNQFSLTIDGEVKPKASDNSFIVSAMTNAVIQEDENFYIEASLTIDAAQGGSNRTGGNVYFGICTNNSENTLSLLPFQFFRAYNNGNYQSNNGYRSPKSSFFLNSKSAGVYSSNAGFSMQRQQSTHRLILQRYGNIYTIVMVNGITNNVIINISTGSTEAIKIVAQLQNHLYGNGISGVFNIYTF